jgi:hypothetical protein
VNFVDPLGLWPDPNWGNRLEGYITNAGAGLGDGLSLGATGVIRNGMGAGDAVDTTSAMYKAGVATGVAVTVITTGNAAGAGAAMGTTGGAMVTGGVIGGASSLVEQNTQIGAGTRSQFDVAAVIVETVIGAAVGGIFSEASKLIGNMIRGAGGQAGAAARGAGSGEAAGCGGGAGGGSSQGSSWTKARGDYWKNRASNAAEGEFSPSNLDRMRKGKPPLHDEIGVPKELHHNIPRRDGGSNAPDNLQEVWPWEHEQIDPYRHYDGPRP